MDYAIQPMAESHGPAVIDIFNHFIATSMAAYPEGPVPHEFFSRFLQMMQGYPALVVTVSSGQVVGFGFLRPFHPASTLRRTAEVTYFILPEFTRLGIGTALLQRLIEQARPMGVENLVANVSSQNEPSIAFHRKNGFHVCGCIERAGRKHDQDFDVMWMQRPIAANPPTAFTAVRVTAECTQHLLAPPSRVFPLLCPTREYAWIELWKCRLIYSATGFAERDCVFTTHFPGEGGQEVWVVSSYEPDREIQFVRTNDLRVIRYSIALSDNGDGTTDAVWRQVITTLNLRGNDWVRDVTQEQFRSEIKTLEKLLNHYLTTGEMLRTHP